MELTYEETEHYINEICAGVKFSDINNVQFLFKQPMLVDKVKANFIYEQEYANSIAAGFITNQQMTEIIESRELITTDEKNRVSKLKNELLAQRTLLAKTTKMRARQDTIKETIATKQAEINAIEVKERAKYAMTAETKAEEARVFYLCWASSYNFSSDNRYWLTYNDFLDEDKYLFRQEVVSNFLGFFNGLLTGIVRAVARSSLWRIKYVTSMKTSDKLFGVSTADYSNDMSNLAYWSQYYNNIYEMLSEDRPPDDIIDDDEALDAYMNDYYQEKSKEMAVSKGRNRHGKLSAYDKEEVIVTREDPLYEHIEYDTPREAKAIKDKASIQKKTRRR